MSTPPDFKAMSITIGQEIAKDLDLHSVLGNDESLRLGLGVQIASAVWPYLELVWEMAERKPERLCACGCGQPVMGRRPEAKYATGACRVRAHRRTS